MIDQDEGARFFKRLVWLTLLWAGLATAGLAGFVYLLVHLFGSAGYWAVALGLCVMLWAVSFDRFREMEENVRRRERLNDPNWWPEKHKALERVCSAACFALVRGDVAGAQSMLFKVVRNIDPLEELQP